MLALVRAMMIHFRIREDIVTGACMDLKRDREARWHAWSGDGVLGVQAWLSCDKGMKGCRSSRAEINLEVELYVV